MTTVLLSLLPLALLVAALAAGWYPGEETLARVGRGAGRTPRVTSRPPRVRHRAMAVLPRGDALIAAPFVSRPPPAR